jgi:hypothetical protein
MEVLQCYEIIINYKNDMYLIDIIYFNLHK